VTDRVVPVPERRIDHLAGVPDQGLGEQPERLRLGSLRGGEVEAPDRLGERLQQEALSLTAPAADRLL
jgi:hypothetical protein